MIVPRLCLMRESASDKGSIYVHLDWHVGHYGKVILDEIFWKRFFPHELFGAEQMHTTTKTNLDHYGINSVLLKKAQSQFGINKPTPYSQDYINFSLAVEG